MRESFTIIDVPAQNKVIFDANLKKYYIFDTLVEFYTWYSKNHLNTSLHEVIFGHLPQKLRFDIDGPVDINELIDVSAEFIYEFYGENISKDQIIIYNNGDKSKFSYHIIFNGFYVADNYEAGEFAKYVVNLINVDNIDLAIYKSKQNLRLPFSSKDNRIKGWTTRDELSKKDTIFNIDKVVLINDKIMKIVPSHFEKKEIVKSASLSDVNTSEILSQIDTSGFIFREQIGNMLLFDRIAPCLCRICNIVHDNENSMYIFINHKYNNIYNIREFCRRNVNKQSYDHGDVELGKFVEKVKIDITDTPEIKTKFDNVKSNNIYNEPEMRDYEIHPTLCVRAQMGLGKTKKLIEYIDKNYNENSNICVLSFRRTFGSSMNGKLKGFKLYSEIDGTIKFKQNKKIIIQSESLHRLERPGSFHIDLLILDEVESILEQFNSGLHSHLNVAFAIFEYILRTAEHVICMDANLGDRTFNILHKYRESKINDYGLFLHENTYIRSRPNIYISSKESHWLFQLKQALNNNQKIVIPTNSLSYAKSLVEMINSEYPDRKVLLYSSETTNKIKKEHFANVDKYWSTCDILIFTPTCSAGISFEVEHFDVQFCMFTSLSCNVETCRQMMSRVRNIKTNNNYVYIQQLYLNLPTTSDAIQRQIRKNINILHSTDDNIWLSYDDNGNIKFYTSPYFHLWIENTIVNNHSKNNFSRRFIAQAKSAGAIISLIEPCQLDENISEYREKSKEKSALCIAQSEDITDTIAANIKQKIEKDDDVTVEEIYALKKYSLKTFYKAPQITYDFVLKYNTDKAKRIYKYLCQINSISDLKEVEKYLYIQHLDTAETVRRQQFKYNHHKFVQLVLESAGFKLQLGYICKILPDLTNTRTLLISNPEIYHDLNLSVPQKNKLKTCDPIDVIKYINKLLDHMYGYKIDKMKIIDISCLYGPSFIGASPYSSSCTSGSNIDQLNDSAEESNF